MVTKSRGSNHEDEDVGQYIEGGAVHVVHDDPKNVTSNKNDERRR
jgi:hypothetical protein